MGMPRNAERMRMDEFAIRKLVGVIEKVRGRKEECVHEYQEQTDMFSKLHHTFAKIRKKRKVSIFMMCLFFGPLFGI